MACGHVFTDGYFRPDIAAAIFSKTMEYQKVGYDVEGQRHVSARMVERVARYIPDGAWMDVGVGNGSLIFTAAEWGYTPVGVDLRQENVEALRKLGFEAYAFDFGQLDQAGRFSVISMADVLEHMPSPSKGLIDAYRLLQPGGALLLSMPNLDSVAWKLLDANRSNPYWGELEHYHNFGRVRLYSLLREHGFTPASYGVSQRYRVCMEVIALRNG